MTALFAHSRNHAPISEPGGFDHHSSTTTNRKIREEIREESDQETRDQLETRPLRKNQDQEKLHQLASLGTMVAGVAHEIRNPLNFVANFSMLSKELLRELETILASADREPTSNKAKVKDVLQDLRQANEYILEHGRRASEIVQDMVGLAQGKDATLRLGAVNQIVEKYASLAYQSRRLQNTGLAINLRWELDAQLKTGPMIPQSLGRVLINLVNNAMDALVRKKVAGNAHAAILIRTSKEKTRVIIDVLDNGEGIPTEDGPRIFEAFFTTKAKNDGNMGLGLALSKEIVEEQLGGELSVAEEDGLTRFRIALPRS